MTCGESDWGGAALEKTSNENKFYTEFHNQKASQSQSRQLLLRVAVRGRIRELSHDNGHIALQIIKRKRQLLKKVFGLCPEPPVARNELGKNRESELNIMAKGIFYGCKREAMSKRNIFPRTLR